MFCPQCRTELPNEAKFCVKCRYNFAGIKTPSSKKHDHDSLDSVETLMQQELDIDSFAVGSLFASRYEILSEGHKGGMGAVYKCKDTMLNKTKALKVIHPRLVSSKQAISRFRQEVAISQELQHENIVRVYDIEEWQGNEYFTMEWVEGRTLRDVIVERKKEKRPFIVEEAYRIISQVSEALEHAHRFTVHRDIKPENILVSDEIDVKVKLSDFGIAKMLSPSQFTSTSMQMGTPYYMAPEQKVDAGNVDKRADIYALGVVLFELLTLENTIGLELPSELNKALPPVIDTIIKKAVATKPSDRYGDVHELSEALKKVVDGFSEQAEQSREQAEEQKRREEENRQRAEEQKRKEADQKKRTEEEKARLAKEKAEQKGRDDEQRPQIEKTEAGKKAEREKVTYGRKAVYVAAGFLVLIGAYYYFGGVRRVPSNGLEMQSPAPVPAPAPASVPIPATAPVPAGPASGGAHTPAPAAPVEAPAQAKTSGHVQPIVENLRPVILDEDGRGITGIKPGQTVTLGMKYDIIIPKYSKIKEVEVVEYNTLIAPNGKKIDNPSLTRTKMRSAGGIEAGIEVKLPTGMPDGSYKNIAIVKIGNNEYKAEQRLLLTFASDNQRDTKSDDKRDTKRKSFAPDSRDAL